VLILSYLEIQKEIACTLYMDSYGGHTFIYCDSKNCGKS